MIKTAVITSEDLLQIYANHYLSQAQNSADLEYLKSSKVRIFFKGDSKESMVAGFCINSGPNYRTFLPLTSIQKSKLFIEQGFDQKPPIEIACLWIDKSLRRSYWVIFIFSLMFLDVVRLHSAPVIFGTHGKNIKNYFKLALPKIIFFDRMFIPTKGEVCDFWIMKGSKFSMFYCFIFLSSLRMLFGSKTLTRFRLWFDKKSSKTEL
jgi:hypothetical protein